MERILTFIKDNPMPVIAVAGVLLLLVLGTIALLVIRSRRAAPSQAAAGAAAWSAEPALPSSPPYSASPPASSPAPTPPPPTYDPSPRPQAAAPPSTPPPFEGVPTGATQIAPSVEPSRTVVSTPPPSIGERGGTLPPTPVVAGPAATTPPAPSIGERGGTLPPGTMMGDSAPRTPPPVEAAEPPPAPKVTPTMPTPSAPAVAEPAHPAASPPPPAESESANRTVIIQRGAVAPVPHLKGAEGSRHDLHGDRIRVGRGSDNDIDLASGTVSTTHAVIVQRDGDFLLQDTGSSNGTFLNGARVQGRQPIKEGDLLRFGDVELRFHSQ